MSFDPVVRARWQMHFCVLLWGFTAIIGRSISLRAGTLVLWRTAMVGGALLCVPRVRRGIGRLGWRLTAIYAGIGALVALHWITFYASIKAANASVAVTCLALGPIFLALIAPLISRHAFDVRELLLGVLLVPGVWLVAGGVPRGMYTGIGLGIVSTAIVAVFGVLNKHYVERAEPLVVTCVEMLAGSLTMAVLLAIMPEGPVFALPTPHDALLLAALAFGCTLLPFTLSLVALRHLSAFSTQLIVNLEPIYTIVLAMVLLGEQRELDAAFYAGVALILGAVFLHPVLQRRARPAAG